MPEWIQQTLVVIIVLTTAVFLVRHLRAEFFPKPAVGKPAKKGACPSASNCH